MTYSISGKTVFITGGARGIGAETARRLAAKGARVALAGLEPEELEKVAAQCGPDAIWFETDVTDWDALERAVSGTVERLGGIDVVLANAGIATGGLVRSTDPAAWERVIEVNLLGVWRTVRTCLPHVIERRGYILPVASLAAAAHAPVLSAYAASKAGVEAFADSLRAEVAHHGVAVGVAYFSWIATEMVSGADATPASGMMRGRMRGPLGEDLPGVGRGRCDRERDRKARPARARPRLDQAAAGDARLHPAVRRTRRGQDHARGRARVRRGHRCPGRRRVGCRWRRRGGRHQGAGTTECEVRSTEKVSS